mmetsp:Transcript_48386/g.79662  ORF Transcript_48386/g.79662 Transcript_48386/m.79662 type:complete len:86 (+) Transcript_48386:191-448(+)
MRSIGNGRKNPGIMKTLNSCEKPCSDQCPTQYSVAVVIMAPSTTQDVMILMLTIGNGKAIRRSRINVLSAVGGPIALTLGPHGTV